VSRNSAATFDPFIANCPAGHTFEMDRR
jgi:hypothetical protein